MIWTDGWFDRCPKWRALVREKPYAVKHYKRTTVKEEGQRMGVVLKVAWEVDFVSLITCACKSIGAVVGIGM